MTSRVIVSVVTRNLGLDRRIVFAILVVVMLIIAAGHLYVIAGMEQLYLGVPLWLWIQLVVVAILFWIAWIASDLVSPAGGR